MDTKNQWIKLYNHIFGVRLITFDYIVLPTSSSGDKEKTFSVGVVVMVILVVWSHASRKSCFEKSKKKWFQALEGVH